MPKSDRSKRIVLTGGGTAGHVWPLIVVAEELRRLMPIRFLFIGSDNLERPIAKTFYPYRSIAAGKWRRYVSVRNVIDLFKYFRGRQQAKDCLKKFKPDLIFAKGGYVSLPVVNAAKSFRIPVVIHESDIVLGRANQIAARSARIIFTGYPIEYYPATYHPKMIFSGNPVRPEFWRAKSLKLNFNIDPKQPVCLVMGGSQGARSINSMILSVLDRLLAKMHVIHITGEGDFIRCLNRKSQLDKPYFDRYRPIAFTKYDLPALFGSAEVIVSRAGANALAEIAAAAKAAIVIPLPSAASGHQLANAQWFAKKKSIILYQEDQLSPAKLAEEIISLIKDQPRRQRYAQSIHMLAQRNSVSIIASHIMRIVNPDS